MRKKMWVFMKKNKKMVLPLVSETEDVLDFDRLL